MPVIGPALKKLGDVPVLGWLSLSRYAFTSRRDREKYRELIFFVTPIIQRGYQVFLREEMATDTEPAAESEEEIPETVEESLPEGE